MKDQAQTDTLRRKAYQKATTAIRDAHRDEFEEIYQRESEALGVPYKRRLNEEQKAKQQVEELFQRFPHLRGEMVPWVGDGTEASEEGS